MHSQLLKSLAVLGIVAAGLPAVAQSYKVTNILSDGSVPATLTDPNFINPWGVSASPTWWINAQGAGLDYVVAPAGTIAFKVSIPPASGLTTSTGLPAGSVTTGGAVGMLLPNGTKASFLFSTLDGTISGWNSLLGTAGAVAQIAINNSAAGASYPSLAILNNGTAGVTFSSFILAANFGTGNAIEVYDSTFKPTKLTGTFTDPNLPAGYAPFSVHVIGTQIFVNYALRTTAAPFRTVNAPGNGIVDVFDVNGNFVSRAVTGGNLNAPWGIAFAPASFGVFSNDLLVGNFGDGTINVYDPSLWELLPGGTTVSGTTAVSGGDTSTVFFTAGLANEAHGLFAGIANTTVAGSTPTFGFSASSGAATVTAGNSATATISIAPVNGFSGTVTLACSGLPVGATCSFSPNSLTVSSTAVAISTVTIQTTMATASVQSPHVRNNAGTGIMAAMLLPFASLIFFSRRRAMRSAPSLRILSALVVSLAVGSFIVGCTGSGMTSVTPTPAGQSTVVMTATSGATTQQTSVALTVK